MDKKLSPTRIQSDDRKKPVAAIRSTNADIPLMTIPEFNSINEDVTREADIEQSNKKIKESSIFDSQMYDGKHTESLSPLKENSTKTPVVDDQVVNQKEGKDCWWD